jgi:PAS domain S-box-containing protein
MIVIELIYNLSILVAVSVLSGFVDARFKRTSFNGIILQGILFGVVSIIGMLYPFVLTEGIIFDGRSIVISLCAFFFGPISGFISAFIAAAFRFYIGGGGITMGFLVIFTSFFIGFLFYRWRKRNDLLKVKKIHFYLLGVLVHLFMLLYILALPSKNILQTYQTVAITVIGICPIITVLIGKILLDHQLNVSYLDELSRSEQLFRTTFYSIGDAVITTDKFGKINQMNSIAEKLTGWTEKEAKQEGFETVFNIIDEQTGEITENPIEQLISKEKVVGLAKNTILISKSGEKIPIADSASPILDEKGNLTGAVLIFRDQTAERESERRLRESKRQLSTLMSNLPGMAYRCKNDKFWTMVFASDGCYPLTGYHRKELLHNQKISYSEIINNEFRNYVWDSIQEALKLKNPFRLTYKITACNGEEKWVWEQGRGVFNDNGDLLFLEGFIADITESKRIEEELRISENRLNAALEGAEIGLWEQNFLTGKTFRTEKWASMLGYSLDEIDSTLDFWKKIIHPDDLPEAERIASLHESGKIPFSKIQHRLRSKDGSYKWILNWGKITEFDNDGKPLKASGIHLNIDAIVKVQEALRISEEKYRLIAENTVDCITILDLNLKTTYVSPSVQRLRGFTVEEASTQTLAEVLTPPSHQKVMKMFAQQLELEKEGKVDLYRSVLFELEEYCKDGSTIWVELSASFLRDENLKPVGILTITRDITEKKRSEEERLEHERMLRITAEETNSVFYKLNFSTMKYDYIHPAISKITGYTPDELNKTTLAALVQRIVSVKGKEIVKSDLVGIRNSKGFKNFFADYLIKTKSGELKWLGDRSYSLADESGLVTGSVGILTDITTRKKVEEELREAKEKAEEMSRVKSFFFANMSHELRTPLIGIMGYSEILQDVIRENEDALGMAKTIHKSGTRLLDTLNNILRISKIESERVECKPENKDIITLLKEIVNLYIPTAKSRSISLNFEFVEQEIICSIDERLFRDVLNNLINNAIKYTLKGSITVKVYRENGKVIIKIIDTGIGIPKERQKVIWEAFRQVSEGIGRGFEGTGLGLTISKKYIEMMGGDISLKSEEGVGSEFTIELPMTLEQKLIENEQAVIDQLETITPPVTSKEIKHSVLYVENEVVSATFVRMVLASKYEIELAPNAKLALEKLSARRYDVVLIDINLGKGMNGLELSAEIRKIPGYVRTPLVAVTAYAMEEERIEFLSKGLTHYLSKPFGKNDLLNLMDSILS